MGTVLYECSFKFPFHQLFSAVVLIALFCIRKHYRKKLPKLGRYLLSYMIALAIFFVSMIALSTYREYSQIIVPYQNGDHSIAEGYVEDFHPMNRDGRGNREHFMVDGVYFEYSEYYMMQGYHQTYHHGGVITGDGQHLRIGYITMDSPTGNQMPDNVIVYIEALP